MDIVCQGKQYIELSTNIIFQCQSIDTKTDTVYMKEPNNFNVKTVDYNIFFEKFKQC